ncbi:MAG: bifunctional aspartate kinase/homoserine dehydrogenase I [Bacteroidetes bacterium]|nr:bifunctional aspartate kinase/homoserine dehydrogenase I [Bacteroidota bacterium]
MKILKFGGTSVASAERIANVAKIVQSLSKKGEEIAVVVSAMGGVTDMLVEMSRIAASGSEAYLEQLEAFSARHRAVVNQLITNKENHPAILEEIIEGQTELGNLLKGLYLTRDLTPRTMDYILSFGERSNAFILSEVLKNEGVDAIFVNARLLIKTDDTYGAAKIKKDITYHNITRHHHENRGKIAVITGFISSTEDGITTTLGRGGSDYTAAIFAGALDASEIQIWTDVDGVLTADPRKVKQAFPIKQMTYEEAMEMSHFGAKVIYPPTIIPALEKKIPIRIKNSFNPEAPGTLISDEVVKDQYAIKGITSISDVALLTLEGSALFGRSSDVARLFNVLANKNINAILITQGSSEHSISFAVNPQEAKIAELAIEDEFDLEIQAKLIDPIKVERNLSVIAAIGDNMRFQPGISGRVFTALGKNGVNVIATAQGSSERNISVVIRREDEAKALTSVHDVFFLSEYYVLNLFMVGVGLIGGTLLEQIQKQAGFLLKNQYVALRVVALANSKKMIFDQAGIDLKNWKERLSGSSETSDLREFVDKMIHLNLPNSVFIDNTANKEIVKYYPEILCSSISISTPNKVAVSGTYEEYIQLKSLADRNSVKFFYETNVGAGLPVLTTLNDLVYSGDRIRKIEGVLSGSLSFIFNSFVAGRKFSEIVGEAKEKGFTEPDPREDLSGKDVSRKLIILARESGLKMQAEEIEIENILPEACLNAPTVEAFMEELANNNDFFEAKRAAAAERGKVLRFIATLEGDKAFISLQELDETSPFYNLSGSDNMIVFTSDRYHERPLVIKGPGAGAEVTAAGVFAEILRIGYYLS